MSRDGQKEMGLCFLFGRRQEKLSLLTVVDTFGEVAGSKTAGMRRIFIEWGTFGPYMVGRRKRIRLMETFCKLKNIFYNGSSSDDFIFCGTLI